MKAHPLFSIITVTYNAASTLEVTLQSIASQTYTGVEALVIDGASTDGTLAIAERYRSHLARVVSEPDKGLYDAMNKGMALATGDYLCFLNAGDTFHENDTLEKIVQSIEENSPLPDVIYGETALVDNERNFVRMRRLQAPEELNWKSFKRGMLVCHQAFIARRALAMPYDLTYRYSADVDWCIKVMKKSKILHNTHLILINYLENGLTLQNHRASLKERFRVMAHHYGLVTTVGLHLWFAVRAVFKK